MTSPQSSRESRAEPGAVAPLVLRGTALERGLRHGQALRDEIQESIRRWKGTLEHEYGRKPGDVIRRFLDATDFVPAMERWTPGLLEEIRGIAEGACVDFDTMYTFQLLDEMWNNASAVIGEHCSSLGYPASDGTSTWIAQNIDVEAFRDGHQAVLLIQDPCTEVESFVVTSAGVLGFNGMNSHGIGICCNGMMQVFSSPIGLPVACVLRGALQKETMEDAVAFIRDVPHACGQNYLIGGPDGVISLECSANKVVRFQPEEHTYAVWHTNHPLATDDLQPWYRQALEANDLHPFVINSRVRLESLERQISALPKASVEGIHSILASKEDTTHPICGSGRPGELYTEYEMATFASTIMELSSTPQLLVALGPPDCHEFHRLRF